MPGRMQTKFLGFPGYCKDLKNSPVMGIEPTQEILLSYSVQLFQALTGTPLWPQHNEDFFLFWLSLLSQTFYFTKYFTANITTTRTNIALLKLILKIFLITFVINQITKIIIIDSVVVILHSPYLNNFFLHI